LIRYAADFVMVFTSERDARRGLAALPKRLGRNQGVEHRDGNDSAQAGKIQPWSS
jgi:hypothetical protein